MHNFTHTPQIYCHIYTDADGSDYHPHLYICHNRTNRAYSGVLPAGVLDYKIR